jgi:hypothetical protein
MLAILLSLALWQSTLPELAEAEKLRAEPVTPARLQALRLNPLPEYICPAGDPETFRGLDRRQIRSLLARPDHVTRPTRDHSSTGWHYYLSEGRVRDKPFSHHFAEYIFWFSPTGELRSISCFSHLENVHVGWTHAIVHPATYQ